MVKRFATALLAAIATLNLNLCARAQSTDHVTEASLQKALSTVEALAEKQVETKAVVGLAIAVVHKDKVIFAKGFGAREYGKAASVDADTAFQLASVSKPVGATVVAALIGDGKIGWDSKICELDSTFEMSDPWITHEITLRDLYAHRSGLPDHAGDLLEDLGYDRAAVLHHLRYQKPDSSFRSHYAYTNFGLTEAAIAAAKANSMVWEDACDRKLYKPLGMSSTSSRYSEFIARDNKALGHVLINGDWVQKFRRNPDAQSPAGGVSSSANDLAKWMRMELAHGRFDGRQIVAESALAETHHPQMFTQFSPLNGLPIYYGLGMDVSYDDHGKLRLGHSGAFALGVATNVTMIPSEELGIAVLTNSYPVGVAEGLAMTFIDTAVYGQPTHDWLPLFRKVFSNPATLGLVQGFDYSRPPERPTQPLRNSSYVGNYTNPLFGPITILEKDGHLAIQLGPSKVTVPMLHYDRDTFTYETFGENAVGRSGIRFALGPDGQATSVWVENLDVDGQGVFTRLSSPQPEAK